MDLISGKFYWPTTFQDAPTYPVLEEDIDCDVLIIGGGSSGAQCAYYLSETDLDIVVVDKRRIGAGSTSANTALMQYSGEKMFYELVNAFGEEITARHYKLCKEAMKEIEKLSGKIDIEFKLRDTLYYASYEEDVKKLEKDYSYLKKYGFELDWLNQEQIGSIYPFEKRAAIYSYNDGEFNPYKLTFGLLEEAKKNGVRVFEHTEINGKKLESDNATFYTKGNHAIKARQVIVACGYETLEFKLEKNALYTSSYNVVTKPVKDFNGWHNRTLIWETARPYVYMRTTADDRIIIGGLDDNTTYPEDRDSKILNKKDKLIEEFNELFPDIQVEPDFYLAGFYGSTHDGLPIIGIYDVFPNCYFLYAYGDNGTVYSQMLSKILRDVVAKGSNPDLEIYLQNRPLVK
ncbi:NAD(P)/FAD-dependent oxidoreductase [Pseudalkalibacillus caeni]|uniref:FAD-dependent oxidoreductase n=1 Tax=Exobacillus caeni TaxID=2574798 RepID=A0A5R9F4K5_9BACL|nr:FAD-dependent oxidoreductase [Pseudalkalibacillus caeni]TLS36568.1 FAD-dependent oxidoreductase [Pseudalkalibacillus caeni]